MTYAERNLLKGRTGSFCLTIPIIHGTAREGIAAVPHNLPIIHRYLGPYVVIRKARGGSYLLAEPDGAHLKDKIAAYRVVPYYAREKMSVPLSQTIWEPNSSDFGEGED